MSFYLKLGVVCSASLLAAAAVASTDAIRRPNIIVILADDLGYGDIGCYGNRENRTPSIDRLAAEGLRFTDFHSNGPMCTPTRAALLTGLYQNRFGRDFEGALSAKNNHDQGLPLDVRTAARALGASGYATAMFGKWHLGYQPPYLPTRYGFDEFRGLLTGDGDHHSHVSRSGDPDWWCGERLAPEEGYTAELVTRHSIDFIQRNHGRPFFLYCAHLAIHFPWQGPDEGPHRVAGTDYWDLRKLGPHAEGNVRQVVRRMVEAVDRSTGEIVAALGRLGIERRTLVFFTSDNGGYLNYAGRFSEEISSNGPLRGQKGDVFEGGHRVPAVAWWPDHIKPGRVTGQTAITIDLMPTCLELSGAESPTSPRQLDGTSLVPLLLEGKALPPRDLFWRAGPKQAVRRGDWKLVAGRGDTMLFNLAEDVGEQNNLAAGNPEIVGRLQAAYRDWEADVDAGFEQSN